MAARFATVTEEEIRQMNEEATPANTNSTCLVDTETTIPLSNGVHITGERNITFSPNVTVPLRANFCY